MIADAGETTALMTELGDLDLALDELGHGSPSRMTGLGGPWRALRMTSPTSTGRMGCWPNVRWHIVELCERVANVLADAAKTG